MKFVDALSSWAIMFWLFNSKWDGQTTALWLVLGAVAGTIMFCLTLAADD